MGWDGDQRVGAQCDGRLERGVEPDASVEIPAPGVGGILDLDRSKRDRDRRRRENVWRPDLSRDVVDRPTVIAGRQRLCCRRLVDEDHSAAVVSGRRHHRQCQPLLVDVRPQLVPVDDRFGLVPQRSGVQEAGEPRSRYTQSLTDEAHRDAGRADDRRFEHVRDLDPTPNVKCPVVPIRSGPAVASAAALSRAGRAGR